LLLVIFVSSVVFVPVEFVKANGTQLYINPLVISKAPEDVGTKFNVSVLLSNFANFAGFDINLTWDGSIIGFVSADKTLLNSLWPGGWTIVFEQSGADYYELAAVALATSASNAGASALFNVTFQADRSSTSPLQTPIHFAVAQLSDTMSNPIPATVTDGTYTMSAAETIVFSELGVGSDFNGTVLTVDGNGYGVSALPVTFTWDVGSNHTFAFRPRCLGSGGTNRYVWTSTSGLSTSPNGTLNVPSAGGSITGNYKTQYYLTVVSPYGSPGGVGWYDIGSTANSTLANGTVSIFAGSVQAVFTGWSGDATGTGLISNPITMSGPMTAIANWKIQYNLSVVTNPSNLPPIPGTNYYDNWTWVALTAPQYVPNATGVNGVRYNFTYWDVDGASQGMGVNLINIQMNELHVATAHFTVQCFVAFGQAGFDGTATGTVVIVNGSAYAYGNLPFNEWVDNGTTVSYQYSGIVSSSVSGVQFRLSNVTVQASSTTVTSPIATITVTSPLTVTGNYVIQYNTTFYQTGVGSDFTGISVVIDGLNYALPGSFWFDSGSMVSFAFLSPLVAIPTSRPYFWDSTTGLSILQSDSIAITGPGNVTGNYVSNVHNVIVTNITVNSWVYEGYSTTGLFTIKDAGDYGESAWGVLWYNITSKESIRVYSTSLNMGQSTTFPFTWNTTGVPINYPGYTLTVVVTTSTGTNNMSIPNIQVRIIGDVNGDMRVNMSDVALEARTFGSTTASPNWNPATDINGDGVVNMRDIALLARHFGQHYP
jgi:hypothetical protein